MRIDWFWVMRRMSKRVVKEGRRRQVKLWLLQRRPLSSSGPMKQRAPVVAAEVQPLVSCWSRWLVAMR